MWITGGNDSRCDPINIANAFTFVGDRIDPDHYGVYAVFKLGGKLEKHDKVLLIQTTHNRELDGNTEHVWVAQKIKEILKALESGVRVFRFPETAGD